MLRFFNNLSISIHIKYIFRICIRASGSLDPAVANIYLFNPICSRLNILDSALGGYLSSDQELFVGREFGVALIV